MRSAIVLRVWHFFFHCCFLSALVVVGVVAAAVAVAVDFHRIGSIRHLSLNTNCLLSVLYCLLLDVLVSRFIYSFFFVFFSRVCFSRLSCGRLSCSMWSFVHRLYNKSDQNLHTIMYWKSFAFYASSKPFHPTHSFVWLFSSGHSAYYLLLFTLSDSISEDISNDRVHAFDLFYEFHWTLSHLQQQN